MITPPDSWLQPSTDPNADLWYLAAAIVALVLTAGGLGLGALAEYWWKRTCRRPKP